MDLLSIVYVLFCKTQNLNFRINELVNKYPATSFGSYPSLVNQFYKTRITYETTSAQELESIRLKALFN